MADWTEKSICSAFAEQAQPRVEDRIGCVAANNQYVFFADIHDEKAVPALLSDPATLSALKNNGHETLGLELFNIGHNQIFEAYENGDISDRTMRLYIEQTLSNLESDIGLEDDETVMKHYADMIINAKEEGIKVRGLGALEGFHDMSPEEIEKVLNESAHNDLLILKAITLTPEYFDATIEQRTEWLNYIADHYSLDEDYKYSMQAKFGNDNSFSVPASGLDENVFITRMQEDPAVANRIAEISEGNPMTIVYGGYHMWRPENDLDYVLGEDKTAVISVFEDSHRFWNETLPQIQKSLRQIDHPDTPSGLENAGDYQLDVKNGIWYDSSNDSNSPVKLTETLQPEKPISQPDIIPTKITPDPASP